MGVGVIGPGGGEAFGEPRVEVERDEEGVYHVCLSGTFECHVDGTVEFYKRMLVVFLGLLDVPGETRKSRRTRDGRTPFVREEQLAEWFGVPHAVISRWYGYWLKQDWRRMLSQRWGEVLTAEVQQQVVEVWVKFPWWSARRVCAHLRAQGRRITLPQVKQVGRESGWTALRQPNSSAGWPSTGQPKLSRSLSPMCDAPQDSLLYFPPTVLQSSSREDKKAWCWLGLLGLSEFRPRKKGAGGSH